MSADSSSGELGRKMPNSEQRLDPSTAEWANGISVEQIPAVLILLAARLAAAEGARLHDQHKLVASDSEKLITAGELAARLGVPESWVRNEERGGRIPGVRIGKYVRFKLSAVERALADRKPDCASPAEQISRYSRVDVRRTSR